MSRIIAAALAATVVAVSLSSTPALAQKRGDQGEARDEMRAGNIMRLSEIERRVLPTMQGAEYLGPAYDSVAMAYRLKFIRDGRVMYVDVDARTGRVLRRSR